MHIQARIDHTNAALCVYNERCLVRVTTMYSDAILLVTGGSFVRRVDMQCGGVCPIPGNHTV